jgi:hypothetical protein
MSTLVNDIYIDVCDILLEPSGLSLGLLTEPQFLQYLRGTLDDFLGRTGLVKAIAVMPQEYGQPQVTLPDWISQPDAAFSDGVAIRRDFEGDISSIDRNWQSKIGPPRSWRQDKQYPNQVSLFPAPAVVSPLSPNSPPPGQYGAVIAWAPEQSLTAIQAFIGTMIQTNGTAAFTSPGVFFGSTPINQFSRGNVCAIGPVGLLSENISLNSPIEALTDDWTYFLKYGVLEKIWLSDSELKDVQRARYAHARYEEGIMLAAAVMGEEIDQE